MSSARNHRERSHGSYKNKVSTLEAWKRSTYEKAATRARKEASRASIFSRLAQLVNPRSRT